MHINENVVSKMSILFRSQFVQLSGAETGNPGELGQHHGCRCPGFSGWQGISSHAIDMQGKWVLVFHKEDN